MSVRTILKRNSFPLVRATYGDHPCHDRCHLYATYGGAYVVAVRAEGCCVRHYGMWSGRVLKQLILQCQALH